MTLLFRSGPTTATWTIPAAVKDPRDHTTFAHHIRGRVRIGSRGWIYISVVNVARDRVINSDGPFRDITEAFADVEARVFSARGAWMYSLTGKSVGR